MIDLTPQNNSCPSCEALENIKAMLSEFAFIEGESVYDTLDLITSELKMWRATSIYEKKKNAAVGKIVMQKLSNNGLEIEE